MGSLVPPFDCDLHINAAVINEESSAHIAALRAMLAENELYLKHRSWANDAELLRFLIARNFNRKASYDMIMSALAWRDMRKPEEIMLAPNWKESLGKELETGKMYINGNDKWGRSILVFDNTVQNTSDPDGQLRGLAWNLESAIALLEPTTDKYVVFIHLSNISIFNVPPMHVIRETILMLCTCYPERLGHCILFEPPAYFTFLWNAIKYLIDAKTSNKVLFMNGDFSDGSANDLKIREVLCDDWKVRTGACQPVLQPRSSPGYSHAVIFPRMIERLEGLASAYYTGDVSTSTKVPNISPDGEGTSGRMDANTYMNS
jgi:hypothetical protein